MSDLVLAETVEHQTVLLATLRETVAALKAELAKVGAEASLKIKLSENRERFLDSKISRLEDDLRSLDSMRRQIELFCHKISDLQRDVAKWKLEGLRYKEKYENLRSTIRVINQKKSRVRSKKEK